MSVITLRGPLQAHEVESFVDDVMQYINHPDILAHFANFTAKTRDEEKRYLESILVVRDRPSDYLFGVLSDEKWVGQIGIHQVYWAQGREKPMHGRLGLILNPEYHGQGIGSRAFSLALSYGFDVLGVNKLWAMVRPENEQMKHVLTKAGMQFEGRLVQEYFFHGQLQDMDRYYRLNPNSV